MNRSASVRDIAYAKSGRQSNPAVRLRARDFELEKDSQMKKQIKLSTSAAKRGKKKLLKALLEVGLLIPILHSKQLNLQLLIHLWKQ